MDLWIEKVHLENFEVFGNAKSDGLSISCLEMRIQQKFRWLTSENHTSASHFILFYPTDRQVTNFIYSSFLPNIQHILEVTSNRVHLEMDFFGWKLGQTREDFWYAREIMNYPSGRNRSGA